LTFHNYSATIQEIAVFVKFQKGEFFMDEQLSGFWGNIKIVVILLGALVATPFIIIWALFLMLMVIILLPICMYRDKKDKIPIA